MSLTLEFNDRLLVGGNGTATIDLDNEVSIEIMGVHSTKRISYSSSPNPVLEVDHFFVIIGQLPTELQALIRSGIGEKQRKIDDNSPIHNDYKLVIMNHTTYKGHAALRLGKQFVVYARRPYDLPKYVVGTITGFTPT